VAGRQKFTYYDSPHAVGKRVKEAREAAGVTQAHLGGRECTPAYVSRIEKGHRVPSLQLMRQFAERLGVSEAYLAYGSGAPAPIRSRRLDEARVAIRVGDLQGARELVNSALDAARSDRDRAEVSAAFGEISAAAGEWPAAVEHLERARFLDRELERTDPSLLETLGRSHAHMFDYAAAIAAFTGGLEVARSAEDRLNEVRFATLLAHAQSDIGDFAAAKSSLAIAVRLSDDLRDPMSLARALWAQSRVAALQGSHDAAARYAQSALEYLEVNNHTYFAALARQLLASIETDRGNAEQALELLEHAEPLLLATGRQFDRASFMIEKARSLVALGRRDEAGPIAMEAAGVMRSESSVGCRPRVHAPGRHLGRYGGDRRRNRDV
jgi:transcriptional regulator with XRE-family HTH domain